MRTTLKRMVLASSLAVMAYATPAMATTYNLGTLQAGTPVGSGGVVASTSNPTDTYVFSLNSPSNVGAGVNSVPPIVFGPGLVFGLSDVRASFYSGAVGSGTLLSTLTGAATAQINNLAAGSYYVVVSGTAFNPALGGTYAVSLFSTNAAPAPGPAGLLVAGAGAAAMFWRRRKANRAERLSPALAAA